jgi:hypothetical protein
MAENGPTVVRGSRLNGDQNRKPSRRFFGARVRDSERVATTFGIGATTQIFQVRAVSEIKGRRFQIVRAHWIVVRQNDGQRKSVPVFIRRPIPLMTWCRHGEARHV